MFNVYKYYIIKLININNKFIEVDVIDYLKLLIFFFHPSHLLMLFS